MSAASGRWIEGLPVNAQFRDELRRFMGDHAARLRALGLAAALAVTLVLAWPARPAVPLEHAPTTYTSVGTVALLLLAYLALVGGLRRRAGGGRFTVQEWAAYVPLAPSSYLLGTLAGRMLEPALLIVLMAPMMVAGAMADGVTALPVLGALLILAGTALTARLAQFTLILWLETRAAWLAGAVHAAWAGMFAAGEWGWGPLSPRAALLSSLQGESGGGFGWVAQPWPGFLLTHAVLDGALFALAWWRVLALRRGEGAAQSTRRA